MNPIDKTDPSQNDTICFEIDLSHPPEKVWRALTDPALLSEWLLPTLQFGLTPGAAVTFKTRPFPGWDGTVRGQMLELEAPRRLRYTWVVGEMALETIVTFTLTPTDAGTRLVVVQSGFKPEQKQNFGGARYGWNLMGGKLIELLARTA